MGIRAIYRVCNKKLFVIISSAEREKLRTFYLKEFKELFVVTTFIFIDITREDVERFFFKHETIHLLKSAVQ